MIGMPSLFYNPEDVDERRVNPIDNDIIPLMISFLMIGTVKWNETEDLGNNHINFLLFLQLRLMCLKF